MPSTKADKNPAAPANMALREERAEAQIHMPTLQSAPFPLLVGGMRCEIVRRKTRKYTPYRARKTQKDQQFSAETQRKLTPLPDSPLN